MWATTKKTIHHHVILVNTGTLKPIILLPYQLSRAGEDELAQRNERDHAIHRCKGKERLFGFAESLCNIVEK